MTRVNLSRFNPKHNYDRGCSVVVMAFWQIIKSVFFLSAFPWPSPLRVWILRLFGAKIGRGVYIKPRVNIHLPWRLQIDNDCWLGEGCWILNLERVVLRSNVCISQDAFLCTGNHDYRIGFMPYRNKPIFIHDGAWVGARAFIAPGVTVGEESVICAGSVLLIDSLPSVVYQGNPAQRVKLRW